MTDLHCHILPGVDDGAEDMQEALDMARLAADSGVRAIVATPHCNLPQADEPNYLDASLLQQVSTFRQALQNAQIPIKIYAGAEVFCTPEIDDLLQERKLMTLAGSKYLLTEFYFDESPDFMEECSELIRARGFIPVIAHPERYEAVQHAPGLIQDWFLEGNIIQLNKGSILGKLGRRAEDAAAWILERGLAHTVASDAHGSHIRTPHMHAVRHHLEEAYAPEYARILLSINPGRIIRDQKVLET